MCPQLPCHQIQFPGKGNQHGHSVVLTFSVNVLKGRINGWVFTFSSREIPYFHPFWLCRNVLSSNILGTLRALLCDPQPSFYFHWTNRIMECDRAWKFPPKISNWSFKPVRLSAPWVLNPAPFISSCFSGCPLHLLACVSGPLQTQRMLQKTREQCFSGQCVTITGKDRCQGWMLVRNGPTGHGMEGTDLVCSPCMPTSEQNCSKACFLES